ncbi:ArgS-related anticodon-binding protein NrtL [Streptomyces sp. NPDC049915]|uniref:ArgS-related anticodon-binding protein NrtL n=1 Tax=Streptomyces sp. NPDC049915 TaxID=3155510 RepID=UPI00342BD35B
MTPAELSRTVLCAVRRAVDAGELSVSVPERAVVTVPGPGGCGDYATNIALQLARPAGRPPRDVAELLQGHLVRADGVSRVEITGPGFLNISLEGTSNTQLVRRILDEGLAYGHTDALAGQVIELRVPYEIRAEVVADALARIAATQGARVEIGHGHPQDVNLRPLPAPEDPTPLGPDAARWALLHPAPHDRPRITADHLVQRETNPLFRVRYAHARTRALHRNAADLGFGPEPAEPGAVDRPNQTADRHSRLTADRRSPLAVDRPNETVDRPDPTADRHTHPAGNPQNQTTDRPTHPPADPHTPLLAALADHPRILRAAVTHRGPDRLARHLVTVADATLALLPGVLPRGEEKPSAAHRARLALAEAAGTVLAGGLSLLGIDAPDHL